MGENELELFDQKGFYDRIEEMKKHEIPEGSPMPAVLGFGIVVPKGTDEMLLTVITFLRTHGYPVQAWVSNSFEEEMRK